MLGIEPVHNIPQVWYFNYITTINFLTTHFYGSIHFVSCTSIATCKHLICNETETMNREIEVAIRNIINNIIRCSCTISYSFEIVFNKSLSNGIIIIEWKSAFVSPIYKSGSRNDIVNYRPISDFSVTRKLFETSWKLKSFISHPRDNMILCLRRNKFGLVFTIYLKFNRKQDTGWWYVHRF